MKKAIVIWFTFIMLFSICKLSFGITSSEWQTYSNSDYSFSIQYPKQLQVVTSNFYTSYMLNNTWRAFNDDTTPPNPANGKLLLSIPVFRIDQSGKTYPAPIKNVSLYPTYYNTEVRVGVSSNPVEIKNCTANNTKTTSINGITFAVYDLSDNAMMHYMSGKSYRTVHNNQCFAIEQLVAGTNMYNDENTDSTANNKHISQQVLNRYTNQALNIIQTFKFTK